MLHRMNQAIVISISVSWIALLLLTDRAAGYTPPSGGSPPNSPTTIGGPRGGCDKLGKAKLTPLAPRKHVGQAAATHPTFAWFIPDEKPYSAEFRLYAYLENNTPTLLYRQEMETRAGIMHLTLPKDAPGLVVGQRHLWQVIVLCNPNSPSAAILTQAQMDVVELPAALKATLAKTTDPLKKADLYAEAGLWYDAFAATLATSVKKANQVKLALLEKLAALEESDTDRATQLRQVIEIEKQKI